jgi:hypothetical protein
VSFCYDEFPDRSKVRVPTEPISTWEEYRVMAAWAVHAGNRAYLEFMAKKGDFKERLQAARELLICGRKMAFWERHPNWSRASAERTLARVRSDWNA